MRSLDYLVVGDEGSPLYEHGSKGKKIVTAEEQENTQIISERDFLDSLVKKYSSPSNNVHP